MDGNDPHIEYIRNRQNAIIPNLLVDPKNKDVLSFGCGVGADMYWAATRGAKSILGIDLIKINTEPLATLIAESGSATQWDIRQQNIQDLDPSEKFDLIISVGAFEHVFDVKGTLESFRGRLRRGGRAAIHVDGLWYSSLGGHLGVRTWDHLILTRAQLKEKYPDRWNYPNRCNRITTVDFFEALRTVGAIIFQLRINHDSTVADHEAMGKIRAANPVSPTDLAISGVFCEIAWLEHC